MKLRAHGMAVDAPRGWEVRISRRRREGQEVGAERRPVLHAATVALPEERGDFGGGVTPLLSEEDLFVSLFEYGPEAVGTPLFATKGRPRPTVADFAPNRLQRSIPGQSGCQWFFQEGGRAFCLYVVLGSHARRAALVNRLNDVLATLDLDADASR
ncbi:hypothetical protein CLV92_102220 [Kineococcus xinjiangensis]|uniref:Uncharacterized protein n=1 Tax=Kineococcus xinjiangensis TaxID=512762 RepID=A0A2S6IUW5_9ACTN|nr:hypothetical protein [Kineococcus xinjiangensis]PPK98067.1 hypothetical protein CLV92_102220 [Kineococcus xinjiangensis]